MIGQIHYQGPSLVSYPKSSAATFGVALPPAEAALHRTSCSAQTFSSKTLCSVKLGNQRSSAQSWGQGGSTVGAAGRTPLPASSLASLPEVKILAPHKRQTLAGESAEQSDCLFTDWSWGWAWGWGRRQQMGQELELKYFKCHL